jgi:drug/metabolite transporter (DMT)-like permease
LSSIALLLILVSAGIHATWNLFAKRLPGGAESVWLFTAIAVAVYTPVTVLVFAITGYRPAGIDWVFLIGTGMLQAVYFIILRRGYAAGDLSIVYPLARGTGPLTAMALAILLIGERPSPLTIGGALVITVGTLLLATPMQGHRNQRLAIRFGLITGVVIGCYTAWDGYAVGSLDIPALILVWFADAGRMLWLTPLAATRTAAIRATWRTHKREAIGIGVLSTGSYTLVLLAMAIAPVSAIAPAREVSIVVGTLLGMTVLAEPVGARRLSAAAIIAFGVLLVALG